MIPLKDDMPTGRVPRAAAVLIALNVVAYVWQRANGLGFDWTLWAYGVVPYEFWRGQTVTPHGLVPVPFTILSSMFLHGGLAHLGFNMLFLWVFGRNVEEAMGSVRFVSFYLLGGVAAALAQILLTGPEPVPMVGASGAIAAVLGAYLMLYPRARVLSLVPILIFLQFVWIPASIFLALWFAIQLLSSLGGGGPVAWYAHIGGFVVGMAIVWLFVPWRVRVRSDQARA